MGTHLTRGESAVLRGTHEVELAVRSRFGNPYSDVELTVEFREPCGTVAAVDGYYDGGDVFKARAYCRSEGRWTWRSRSNHPDLDGRSGAFRVEPSPLPGKLTLHPEDERQFACANGEWFLHLGDTGYRYLADSEPYWREYLEQAARSGMTKLRIWTCQSRGGVEALYQSDRRRLNLAYWREMDRRLVYALNHYPHVQLQLILFGEDADELLRYGEGEALPRLIVRTAIARFSALANVHWCFSNDLRLDADAHGPAERPGQERELERADRIREAIRCLGREFREREPWGTLMTNHQSRFSGYSFLDEAWSDIVTLEDIGQVDGRRILEYRRRGSRPVVLDEDRYEHWREPKHKRYFFRRLMWASLLSGGHATYGGLSTYEPYDGGLGGVQGYYDACRSGKLAEGAHDFRHIASFFRSAGLTLAGMIPDDALAGGEPLRFKAARSADGETAIVYLANPTVYEGHRPDRFGGVHTDAEADAAPTPPAATLALPDGRYRLRWYGPVSGEWVSAGELLVRGAAAVLTAPGGGDWVLLVRRTAGGSTGGADERFRPATAPQNER